MITADALASVVVGMMARALAPLRDRLATLEARAPVAGPPGEAGAPGRDGRDGLGFDDLDVAYDGDRTITLSFTRDGAVKAFPIVLAIPIYRDQYRAGATYERGDVVTHKGSAWHCHAAGTVATPGDGSPAWRLMVKHGRDAHARDPVGAR